MEQEEDRLSSLPKIILYDILSMLPEKDATRTSVLSKDWLDTWNTFPILSFCVTQIIGMPPQPTEKILRFCDYVSSRMLRFRYQSFVIKQFKLRENRFGIRYMSKYLDIWLKLACESGVEVIQYESIGREPEEPYYVLPMCVIEAKSLTKLVLLGSIKIEATFMNHSIKFSSLRELSMSSVLLGDGQVIEHLISFCPWIEFIHLDHCYVSSPCGSNTHPFQPIETLSISGLQKLKAVDVFGIQEVFIDAPSLEKLDYSSYNFHSKIDFDRCRNLKKLYLGYVESFLLTDKWFLDLFSKFPFLESLKLKWCRLSEMIDISSFRLKVLELLYCRLKEVNIDAPNLLSCKCGFSDISDFKPIISFLRTSNELEVKILIRLHFVVLCELRKFVQNIKPHGVLTSLSLIILRAIMFFYETLMRRKDEDCFCSSSDTKCWWHDLKDVKFINSMNIGENVDLKTMLDSLPTLEYVNDENFDLREKISLILEF